VRLLLDEMLGAAIAVALRERGHDVVAVVERAELRGLPDGELLERAAGEKRVVVTENAARFVPLVQQFLLDGRPCAGVLITSPASLPRWSRTVVAFVRALERELLVRPGDDALAGQVAWLGP
jgi:hypothetical protein